MVCGGNTQLEMLKKNKLKTLNTQENKLHQRLIKNDTTRIKKEITDNNINNYIITAKRIKVTPLNNLSRNTINDGIAIGRKLWNKCVTEINLNPKLTEVQLRDLFITKKNMSNKNIKELDWTFRIQQKVREAVTRKFYANYKTAQKNFEKQIYKSFFKKKKNKTKKIKKKIVMQFRNKSDEKQSIYLNKEVCKFKIINNKTILETFNGVSLILNEKYTDFDITTTCNRCNKTFTDTAYKAHLKIKKPCKENLNSIISGIPQSELTLQRIGYDYYLLVPESKSTGMKLEAKNEIVSIDAGWNTLLTYFSPDFEWGEICPGIKDKLNCLRSKIKNIEKHKIKHKAKHKAIKKRKRYILNMMDDLHWKICHWLLSKFRKIIISRLYVTRTNKQGKQTQADLKLCLLVDRLIHKSIEYPNSEIHICKEHYTSIACTKCLSLNTTKDTTVRCKDCKTEIHRDLNGARNIFLKHCY